ncbi:inositol transporter 2 [Spatholobus suberectus]|nr:inositol transporter 2 [Spatholobus suberectus]
MALAGAIIGASVGGWINDRFGRKKAIVFADTLFFIGSVVMAAAINPAILIVGRVFVGLGVGMASMASPLYISEAVTNQSTGNMEVDVRSCSSTSFDTNHIDDFAPRITSLGKEEEAKEILRRIYPPQDVEDEINALKESVEMEVREASASDKVSIMKLLKTKTVRRGLYAGMGLQIFQQFVGINTVMYYSPTIVQLAGFASNRVALLLSLVIAGLNAFGSILSIYFIDKTGRRKLLLFSLSGVVVSLVVLTVVFHETTTHSPMISTIETSHFNNTCPDYSTALNPGEWDCMKCLKASPECGCCASRGNKHLPGACLISNDTTEDQCHKEDRLWYTRGCPSQYGWLALIGLALYIIFFSPGMGTVPWVVNSEIYPLRYRGICGGMASTSNWVSNLIVAQSFLSLTQAIGTSSTFMIFIFITVAAIIFVIIFVPETKGLPIEEVENMLERRSLNFKFWQTSPDSSEVPKQKNQSV